MAYGIRQQMHAFWYMITSLLQCTAQVVLHLRNFDPARKVAPRQKISVDNAQLHH